MNENIPNDPAMLLSYVNLKLRDKYNSLDSLCDDLFLEKEAITAKLAAIDYTYDEKLNQFT